MIRQPSPLGLAMFNAGLGLRPLVKGLDFYRYIEYCILLEQLWIRGISNGSLLDLGCGEEPLSAYLAARCGLTVTALDADEDKIMIQNRYRASQGLEKALTLLKRDGVDTGLAEDSIDNAVCLALMPLLANDRDISIMREIGRIVRPGGLVFVSTTYGRNYEERSFDVSAKGFLRVYDMEGLKSRIINPSGLTLREMVFFGARTFRFDRFWYSLPFLARLPIRFLSPLLSTAFLSYEHYHRRPEGAFLILSKETS